MTAVAVINPEAGQLSQPARDVSLVERALDKGMPIEVIKELMDLSERQRAVEARRAFDGAMALASAEMPTLFKTASADRYKFEDLALIIEAVREPLSKYGLSFRWRITQERSVVRVTFILSQKEGHYEETSLEASPEKVLPNGNAVQNLGATVSYLQRYTFKAGLGVAATKDTDGRLPMRPEPRHEHVHDEDGVIHEPREDPLLEKISTAVDLDTLRALKEPINRAGKPKWLLAAWNDRKAWLDKQEAAHAAD